MQTFIPYPSITECAKVLDWRRLGKQRVEGMQILNCLREPNSWVNHPAVEMWRGYEEHLKLYINTMIDAWLMRGYKNTMKQYRINWTRMELPSWWGFEKIHSSHRANLLRKDPEHYGQFGWTEEPTTGYWWPYRRVNGEWVVCE